ncbi:MAG: DUF2752 domain-containing protein [Mucilaginibacter sp.]|uniref:DUF2752 domain-containing protein n=1 Tax=Mucilaginibacter sp. TaxID=1882438 RepID=UPI0032672829
MNAIIFCSHLNMFQWLQNYLIPCPFKKLTGIDCPGCGFQRSVIALLEGNLHQSLALYPAAIPLFITTLFVLFDMKLHFDKAHIMKKILYMVTGNIILFSYLYKMVGIYM